MLESFLNAPRAKSAGSVIEEDGMMEPSVISETLIILMTGSSAWVSCLYLNFLSRADVGEGVALIFLLIPSGLALL